MLVWILWLTIAPFLVLSRKIVEHFLCLRLFPPGDQWCDYMSFCFVPAGSVSRSSTFQIFWDTAHLWWSLFPPVYLLCHFLWLQLHGSAISCKMQLSLSTLKTTIHLIFQKALYHCLALLFGILRSLDVWCGASRVCVCVSVCCLCECVFLCVCVHHCMRVCMCVCMQAGVHACLQVCQGACVRASVSTTFCWLTLLLSSFIFCTLCIACMAYVSYLIIYALVLFVHCSFAL